MQPQVLQIAFSNSASWSLGLWFARSTNLVTIKKDGKDVDAVAQVRKHGFVFVRSWNW